MAEKKEFFIPDHVDAKFELIKNVKPRELLIMVPSLLLTGIVFKYTSIPLPWKISLSIFLIGIPAAGLVTRPIPGKQNISLQSVMGEWFHFFTRQREFLYEKEGDFTYVEPIEEGETASTESTEREIDSSKAHTDKGGSKRLNFNKRKPVSESFKG
jgi:hypothetical protein